MMRDEEAAGLGPIADRPLLAGGSSIVDTGVTTNEWLSDYKKCRLINEEVAVDTA
jgi:hypothetical protein